MIASWRSISGSVQAGPKTRQYMRIRAPSGTSRNPSAKDVGSPAGDEPPASALSGQDIGRAQDAAPESMIGMRRSQSSFLAMGFSLTGLRRASKLVSL